MQKTVIVVPCYNESHRLVPWEFNKSVTEHSWLHFLFVNDGSTDNTEEILDNLCQLSCLQMERIHLERNLGKAEAVRQGFLKAFQMGAARIGYWDADLATPLEAIPKLCEVFEKPEINMVIGSRVRLLGRRIERRPLRHYLGRIFATCASVLINLPVYDTQCGAKVFRATDSCRKLFETPFLSRWIFDVELLARLMCLYQAGEVLCPADTVVEIPLQEWKEIGGSKVRPRDFVRAFGELLHIYYHYIFVRNSRRRL